MKFHPPKKPPLLIQLEIVIPRLSKQNPHYPFLYEQLGTYKAGFVGERSLLYHLHFTSIDIGYHLPGVRIYGDKYYFQIDHLIFTPYVAFLIEVKHIKEKIRINSSGQLIRALTNKEEVFANPYKQAEIQKQQLLYFMAKHHLPSIPIHPLVVFSHPKALLAFDHQMQDIIPLQQLSFRIRELMKEYTVTLIEASELNRLNKLLKRKDQPQDQLIIDQYQIDRGDILNGVWCPACKDVLMERKHGYWFCQKCRQKNRDAHLDTLLEHAVLFGPTITNNEARLFLGLDSADTVYRLLKKANTDQIGTKKGRIYNLKQMLESANFRG